MSARQLELGGLVPVPRFAPLFAVSIPVEPQPCPRPRARVVALPGRRPIAQVYLPPDYQRWQQTVAVLLASWWSGAEPISVPLVGQVTAVLPRPAKPPAFTLDGASVSLPPWGPGRVLAPTRSDLDNYVKAAWDAAQRAGVLRDDRFIVRDGGSSKVWTGEGESPALELRGWLAW